MNTKLIVFKAIGNRERVELLNCLQKEQCVSDLLEKCHLSQSALSQHLAVLKQAGLVACTRRGKQQFYRVADKKVSAVVRSLLVLTS